MHVARSLQWFDDEQAWRCAKVAAVLAAALGGVPQANAQGASVQLNEIVVDGKGNASDGKGKQTNGPTGIKGYVADNVSAATKTNTPLVKIPASVSVVTRENLTDRNVQTLNDAVAYTPGAEVNVFGYDPRFDSIYIRGFDTTYDGVYRDGLRLANAAGAGAIFKNEPYGFDSLTVLRGPSAATYGFGSPGGIIDITSKRPIFTQFGEVQVQYGSRDRKQLNFDVGGPVAGTKDTLAYRVTGVFRDANNFPISPDDRIMIAPAFTYRPDGATSFTFLSEYLKAKFPGNAAFVNGPNFSVTNYRNGDPAYSTSTQTQFRVGYAFEHAFSNNLIIRQNLRYSGIDFDWRFTQTDANLAPGVTTLPRSNGNLLEKLRNLTVDNHVEAHLNVGPTKHTLLAGLDYTHSDFNNTYGFGAAPSLTIAPLNYGQQFIAGPQLTDHTSQGQDIVGTYLQDQAEWNRFTLTLSGRHDFVRTFTLNTAGVVVPTASQVGQSDDAFTGRAGLNYRVIDGVHPYVSYATTFIPNLGTGANGQPFAPTRGDQKEAGIKTQIPKTNLHINGAVFEIVESNILRTDPTNISFSAPTGRVRSRGYEVEAIDNIAPGTNLVASYTHVDLRFLDNQSAPTGNQLSGVPGDTVAAFAKYRFQLPGPIGGLGIGGGVRYAGWSFADDANTGVNRAYTLFDAVVSYDLAALDPRFNGVLAQVNGYNIFDRQASTCQAGFCYRVQPATVIGSLTYRW